MTRNDIREAVPGIEDEAMGKLLNLIHKETDALRDAKKAVDDELKQAKADLQTANAEMEKAQKALNDYKAEQDAASAWSKKEAAYRELLKEAGVSEKYIPMILDSKSTGKKLEALALDGNGKFTDAGKLVDAIKADHADFIPVEETKGAEVKTPPAAGKAFSGMSLAEKMEYANAHPNDPAVADWLRT